MINKPEILKQARSLNLPNTTIEKDYVIGWILAGITQHPVASKWIFKGGTCLKKCYFGNYRFSEDLDFSIDSPLEMSEHELIRIFQDIAYWVRERTNIDRLIHVKEFRLRGGLTMPGHCVIKQTFLA